jgi:Ca-activated chloride channel family protein
VVNLPLDINCRVNRSYLQPERTAKVFVSADIITDAKPNVASKGLNISLSIDCSSSMSGRKIETAKDAAETIIGLLKPNDYISIIRFARKASVVIPKQRLETQDEIRQRIRTMKTGSTTALYDGIKEAYKELLGYSTNVVSRPSGLAGAISGAKKIIWGDTSPQTAPPPAPVSSSPQEVSRLILLTDGEPTEGPDDEPSFTDLGKDMRNHGVSVIALGIGGTYKEDLLMAVASSSGGKWHHVTDVSQLPKVFSDELSDMQTVVLVKPELHTQLMAGAELSDIYRVGAMVSEMTENDYTHSGNKYVIPVEDVRVGQVNRIVFKVHVPSKPEGQYRIAKITLVAQGMELSKDIVVDFTSDESRWGIEDPVPRASLELFKTTVLTQRGVGDPTKVKLVNDRFTTILNDSRIGTAVKQDPLLRELTETNKTVIRTTMIKGQNISAEDKKKLKSETTTIKK